MATNEEILEAFARNAADILQLERQLRKLVAVAETVVWDPRRADPAVVQNFYDVLETAKAHLE